MPYSYKGSINFGLVYIPVTLHGSVKKSDISFNQLDKKTMSRIQYVKTCTDCEGREVKQSDIVKGYQYEKGKYVIFDDADFEKLKTEQDKNITVLQFTDLEEIDPIYYDKPFFVNPTGNEKGYKLFLELLENHSKVAIAKAVLGTKETLISIRAKNGQMLINTLHFYDEIQNNPAKDVCQTIDEKELELGKLLIDNMTKHFDPKDFRDEYSTKIKAAIESKIMGKEIVKPKEKGASQVIDLMEALKASLPGSTNDTGNKKPKKPAKSKAERPSANA